MPGQVFPVGRLREHTTRNRPKEPPLSHRKYEPLKRWNRPRRASAGRKGFPFMDGKNPLKMASESLVKVRRCCLGNHSSNSKIKGAVDLPPFPPLSGDGFVWGPCGASHSWTNRLSPVVHRNPRSQRDSRPVWPRSRRFSRLHRSVRRQDMFPQAANTAPAGRVSPFGLLGLPVSSHPSRTVHPRRRVRFQRRPDSGSAQFPGPSPPPISMATASRISQSAAAAGSPFFMDVAAASSTSRSRSTLNRPT